MRRASFFGENLDGYQLKSLSVKILEKEKNL